MAYMIPLLQHAPTCYSWEALLCDEKLGRAQSIVEK